MHVAELTSINKSLSALGHCVKALGQRGARSIQLEICAELAEFVTFILRQALPSSYSPSCSFPRLHSSATIPLPVSSFTLLPSWSASSVQFAAFPLALLLLEDSSFPMLLAGLTSLSATRNSRVSCRAV